MNDSKPVALKPCPFCGHPGSIERSSLGSGGFYGYCNGCNCETQGHTSKAEAIAAWNTRPPAADPVGDKVVEIDPKTAAKNLCRILFRDPESGRINGICYDPGVVAAEAAIRCTLALRPTPPDAGLREAAAHLCDAIEQNCENGRFVYPSVVSAAREVRAALTSKGGDNEPA